MSTTFRPASAGMVNLEKAMQPQVFHAPVVHQASQVVIPSHVDRDEVERLRKEIRSKKASELGTIVPQATTDAAAYGEELLKMAKAGDIDVMETKFAEVIKIARGVDIDRLSNPQGTGWIAKIKSKIWDIKEEVIKSQANASEQINRMFDAVEGSAKAIASRIPVLEQMHVFTQQQYIEYDYLIAAGNLEVEQREAELAQLKAAATKDPANIHLQGQLQEAQFYLQQLKIKVGNDVADQQMAFDMLPQIRLMQSNALTLGQTFATIKGSVMNNWKKKFILALTGDEQKRGAAIQNAVLDMNNELAVSNAKQLRSTTNEVVKANQRGTYDLVTLETVHNETIGAFEDAFKLAQEGNANRAKLEASVKAMKKQMVERFAAF